MPSEPNASAAPPSPKTTAANARWIFLCRHGAEAHLIAELQARGVAQASWLLSGAVEATFAAWPEDRLAQRALVAAADPIYALQVLPAVQRIAPGPVDRQAHAIADVLAQSLDGVDSFSLHALLPGDLRGNPRPPGAGRRERLLTALDARMSSIRRRTWRKRLQDDDASAAMRVQVLLDVDGDAAIGGGSLELSVAPAVRQPIGSPWPSARPGGRQPVNDDPSAPASSFRKLAEAFGQLGAWPTRGEVALDLGASPGGWTVVLRRAGARVLAVDRAPLAPALMRDRGVQHFAGDAFAFDATPHLVGGGRIDWLVSDIVAFPARIIALLGELGQIRRFGAGGPPRFVVVQMKFRGDPDLGAVAAGLAAAEASGYIVRARHLCHDKNEVTIVARYVGAPGVVGVAAGHVAGHAAGKVAGAASGEATAHDASDDAPADASLDAEPEGA